MAGRGLDVRGAEALSGLTSVRLDQLVLPCDDERLNVWPRPPAPAFTVAPSWPLPPQLHSLELRRAQQKVEVLGCLQLPLALQKVGLQANVLKFSLEGGVHVAMPSCRLLPSMQRSLVNAFALASASRSLWCVEVAFEGAPFGVDESPLLLPPAPEEVAAAAAAPAGRASSGLHRPGHGPWLAALGSLPSLAELRLAHVALDEEDVRTIATCLTRLEVLCLTADAAEPPCCPAASWPLLARLPRLRLLALDARFVSQLPRGEVAEAVRALLTEAACKELRVCLRHRRAGDSESEGYSSGDSDIEEGSAGSGDESPESSQPEASEGGGMSDVGPREDSGGRVEVLVRLLQAELRGAGLDPERVFWVVTDDDDDDGDDNDDDDDV
ncbi:hypothetical protein GPECTOR_49g528 [Gonium pectorale]|uniref:Uncharacterized protein n=1 Tax=Gonium pectorale TaxID=33097 RepID=A0A150G7Y0_GONPE|nr:hypothetical protein GPECTOR_49g528 [Gonium pectorale]|eukprot:KXZ45944.1 hypothetical protein GPECTOR_49g528 [Gonium pectorale]